MSTDATTALNSLTSIVLLGAIAVAVVGGYELARTLRIHWRLAGAVVRDRAAAAVVPDRQAVMAAEEAASIAWLITDAPERAVAAAA